MAPAAMRPGSTSCPARSASTGCASAPASSAPSRGPTSRPAPPPSWNPSSADVADDVDVDVQVVADDLQFGGVVPGHGVDVVGAEPGQEFLGAGREAGERVRPLEGGLAGQPGGGPRVEPAGLPPGPVAAGSAPPSGVAGGEALPPAPAARCARRA